MKEAILVTHHQADHMGGVDAARHATGASLDALAGLSPDTRVCFTHEYTLSDLQFSLAAGPGNADLFHYASECRQLRAQGEPTLPSSIGLERRVDPFLRTREPAIIEAARAFDAKATQDQAGIFAAIRQWKNEFR